MAPLGIWRKKKKVEEAKTRQKTLLEELCGDNNELYQALSKTVLLNPQLTVKEGIDSYIEKAKRLEEAGDIGRARISYQVAGELALYEGNLAQMQKFFKKVAEVDTNFVNRNVFEYLSKKENAQRALTIAQEFYTRIGKGKETVKNPSDEKNSS